MSASAKNFKAGSKETDMSKFFTRAAQIANGVLLACALILWIVPQAFAQETPSSLREAYGDWSVSCRQVKSEDGAQNNSCQLTQELRNKKTGQLVLAFAVPGSKRPDGVNAVVVAPFGLKLSEGLSVEVAGVSPVHVPFNTCLPSGCVANLRLNDDFNRAMRLGENATVVMTALDQNQEIRVNISLNGFTAATQRLQALAVN
ncbi:MAG: invasion associated locus B family protein [Rhizobiaceae bacterium]